jgi:hypothetical protein
MAENRSGKSEERDAQWKEGMIDLELGWSDSTMRDVVVHQ